MIAHHSKTLIGLVLAIAGLFALTAEADACAVCFGDPESPMAQGVVWGVLVLVAIVGFVLTGITGIAVFWMYRGRRLAQCVNSFPMN